MIVRLTEVNENFRTRIAELEKIVEATIERSEREKQEEIAKSQFHSHRVKYESIELQDKDNELF